jgi:NADH-quinone oxidoreductase subunit E
MSNTVNHKLYTKENNPVSFSPAVLEKFTEIISHYPEGKQKSALLPVLHIAQEESGGYLSTDVMDYLASLLNIQPIEVYEVATFYSMFSLEKNGKYLIEVCRTGACSITGGEHILEYLKEKLKIGEGETTPDGFFTLRTVECLGACGESPVMQVNTEFYYTLNKEKINRIIDDLREKANPDKPEGTTWAENF